MLVMKRESGCFIRAPGSVPRGYFLRLLVCGPLPKPHAVILGHSSLAIVSFRQGSPLGCCCVSSPHLSNHLGPMLVRFGPISFTSSLLVGLQPYVFRTSRGPMVPTPVLLLEMAMRGHLIDPGHAFLEFAGYPS